MSEQAEKPKKKVRVQLDLYPGDREAVRIGRAILEAASNSEAIRKLIKIGADRLQDKKQYYENEGGVFVPVKFIYL
ncbi:MAG TPA: hypothetical protein VD967_00555 [Candidatus Paceibacterota bacterium]|nr:hypothetical protein [Candidatus Paceibacterota bacterium]